MDVEALEAYVSQAQQRIASADSLSERNTQLRLVQPFLTMLGWSLDRIVAEYTVTGHDPVDFALLVDDQPEVLVQTRACSTELSGADAQTLAELLLDTGIDWGILTNGQAFVFIDIDETGAIDRRGVRLDELPDQPEMIERYTAAAASKRAVRRHEQFTHAARRLDTDREALRADLTERVLATTGNEVTGTVEDAVDDFLDGLSDTFRARGGDSEEATDIDPDEQESRERSGAADGSATPTATSQTAQHDTERGETRGRRDSDTAAIDEIEDLETPAIDDLSTPGVDDTGDQKLLSEIECNEQFVVRFFDGRSSVGAVGHRNAAAATQLAVEYLLEHRDLGHSITLPWGPNDSGVVLSHELDGPAVTLDNGWELDITRSVVTAREAVTALAGKSGLRTMFQGDWSTDE